jgi:hypothetical protein
MTAAGHGSASQSVRWSVKDVSPRHLSGGVRAIGHLLVGATALRDSVR